MAATMTIRGDGLNRFQEAVETLGSDAKAKRAYRMALNTAGKRVFTQTKRAVAKQMGTTQREVVKRGDLKHRKASGGVLQTSVASSGGHMYLKDFKPRQNQKGVSANPWANRRTFGKTFFVGALGGHVFRRTGEFNPKSGRNNNIEVLWGPAVPKELVKDESRAAFEKIGNQFLPQEIARVVREMSKGVIT